MTDFKFVKTFSEVVGNPVPPERHLFASLAKGLRNLPNNNKMRGMLARNIPSSKRVKCPEVDDSETPLQKKTRNNRRIL